MIAKGTWAQGHTDSNWSDSVKPGTEFWEGMTL